MVLSDDWMPPWSDEKSLAMSVLLGFSGAAASEDQMGWRLEMVL
jgi:hypothetical protein